MREMTKTSLMIDSRKLCRIILDGPALKIIMNGRSPILFPLRRLRRIHIWGIPSDGMEAFLSCAEQCIPVAFFHFNGRLRCQLHPASAIPTQVDHWLEYVEFDSNVRLIYEEWMDNQKKHILANLGIDAIGYDNRKKMVVDTLRSYCRQYLDGQEFKSALEWLDGLLHFHLEHLLMESGFSQRSGKQRLLSDIKPVFDLILLHGLAKSVQSQRTFRVNAESMTQLYQSQSEKFEYCVRRMLIQLVNKFEAMI